MAKKDKEALYQDFLADIKAAVGDADWGTIEEKLVKNDKANSKLRDGVLARSEFSQQMDSLSAERKSFEDYQRQEREKIEGWQKWYGETTAQFAGTAEELKAYKEQYGELSTGERRQIAQNSGLTPEQFEKRLNEEITKRDTAALRFVDDLTDIKIEHSKQWGEKLDTAALYKLAGEQGLTLSAAYKEYIAPKVEEKRQKDFDDAISKAKEEGAKEYASKHNLPMVSNIPSVTHVLDVQNPHTNSRDRVGAALKDFYDRTGSR